MGVIMSDEQIPYMLKQDRGMAGIDKFISDEQPDIVVRLGDMLDMEALQGWTRLSPEQVNWDEIRDEIAQANDHMDRQDGYAKRKIERHFWMGNHEERLKHFRDKNKLSAYWIKNGTTVPYLIRDLKLKERSYKVHAQNDLYNFGKLHLFHGDNYSTWHTAKNLAAYGCNLAYGHIHSPQRFTAVSRLDRAPRAAWSLGCLCNRNAIWKNGAPNSWVNGFAIFYLHGNGNFNFYPIDIIRGRFVSPSGKLYA